MIECNYEQHNNNNNISFELIKLCWNTWNYQLHM